MIYIHVPFCRSFCTYCDFYSILERDKMETYKESLLREIISRKTFLHYCCQGDSPYTLYIGGGTPSQLPACMLEEVVCALKSHLPDPERAFDEFTVEVNPDDITPEYVALLRRIGVTRVSMGVQSFNDDSLRWMNRRHDAAGALNAFRILRDEGIDNISIDLIFGYNPWYNSSDVNSGSALSDILMQLWESDLSRALSIAPEHISAYQMSIEPGSALGKMAAQGRYGEPDDEICAAQYALLQKKTSEAGFEQYEISNFALPGRRALHNSGYWDYVPYIGLGPGAHSFDGLARYWNPECIQTYSAPDKGCMCDCSASDDDNMEVLTAEDILTEKVMLGLRRADGLLLSSVPQIDMHRVERLLSRGLLSLRNGILRIPKEHFFISDSIIRELV